MATGLLETLGLPKGTPPGAQAAPPLALTGMRAGGLPPKKPAFLDFDDPQTQATLQRGLREQAAIDKKEAEAALAKVDSLLADVQAYVAAIPQDRLSRSSYAQVMADVRKRFPEAAGLSHWVKETLRKVPELNGRLPSPQALMEAVQKSVDARGAQHGWAMSTGKDLKTLATDRLLAAYMSELPAGVTVAIGGDGTVRLSLEGAAATVATPAGDVEASVGKDGAAVSLGGSDYGITVENPASGFDPKLRAEWKKTHEQVALVMKLKADRDKARLEFEQKKKQGATTAADLEVDFKKKEAVFDLAWEKLKEKIDASAKASAEKISASVAYLQKDDANKDAVKAGLEATVDLKELQGKLDAYYQTQTVEAALALTAAADRVTATLEIHAVKAGVVVTASFEKALEETKAAIEVVARDGKTKLAAELRHKADELTAKLKLVHEQKDLKLAAEIEKTLKDVRGSIEVEYRKGKATVKGGATASSAGEAGGKVQIDIALEDGRTFRNSGDKLSFAAAVSNKGYKFEVTFSMGEPVEAASLQDLFKDADTQIKELYKLAGDKGIRSIEDAATINAEMQRVMQPVKDAAARAKTLKGSRAISASFGFAIEGDWPAGGKAMPPVASVGLTLSF